MAVTACTSDTTVVPLAKLQASFYLLPSSGPATGNHAVGLNVAPGAEGDPCPVLPGGSTITLDGTPGDVDLGGAESPHGTVNCYGPSAIWPNPPARSGPSTIVIDDGDTTWTFIIDQPFARRSFSLVTPQGGTLRTGDAVTLRVEPASGTLSTARVFASTGVTQYFLVDQTSGVVIAGHEIHFTVPTVGAATTSLTTAADLELTVERCDAPLGCNVKAVISSMQPIVLAP